MVYKLGVSNREAVLLAVAISNTLRNVPGTYTAEERAYLINIKASLEQRRRGRRPAIAKVEDQSIAFLF